MTSEPVRHLAILRSLCETLDGGPGYCQCGRSTNSDMHFTSEEYDQLQADGQLVQWRGLTVAKADTLG